MKKRRVLIAIGLFISLQAVAAEISVFVSFSMPQQLLEETLKESVALHIPAYLNGLYHNSMQETALKIRALSQRIPELSLQIDPTAFERFGIHQVPALVVANGNTFDVIYGHLRISEGLLRIADRGESGLTKAQVRRMTDA